MDYSSNLVHTSASSTPPQLVCEGNLQRNDVPVALKYLHVSKNYGFGGHVAKQNIISCSVENLYELAQNAPLPTTTCPGFTEREHKLTNHFSDCLWLTDF